MPAQATTNVAIESAVAAAGQVGSDASWVSAWSSAAGGSYLWKAQLANNPSALALGGRWRIEAGDLTLTQPNGVGATAADAQRALEGRIAGTWHLQWHDGDPGANGTAAVIAGIARTEVEAGDFDVTTS